jgi:hypothetical protein
MGSRRIVQSGQVGLNPTVSGSHWRIRGANVGRAAHWSFGGIKFLVGM